MKAKETKSAFIARYPKLAASELMKLAKKMGVKLKPNYIYVTRHRIKNKKAKAKPRARRG